MITELTLENFASVLSSETKPLIVDFWAEWCAPCQMMKPIFEELAEKRNDIAFARADIDAVYPIAVHFGITSIPAFVLYKNGEAVAHAVGYQDAKTLLSSLGIE